MNINFKRLHHLATSPQPATNSSAGGDIRACLEAPVRLLPGERALIPTGIAVEFSVGYCGLLCPRSGLSLKYGITLLNAPGVIDADYRGEIKAIMVNLSGRPFIVEHGDRVAQLLVMPYERILWIEATELSDTARGSNGFGSSGIS